MPPSFLPLFFRDMMDVSIIIGMLYSPLRSIRQRPGSPTKTHSCNQVRQLPPDLRLSSHMRPSGLSNFYQKYTEAYGIPVVSKSTPNLRTRRIARRIEWLICSLYTKRRIRFSRIFAKLGLTSSVCSIRNNAFLLSTKFSSPTESDVSTVNCIRNSLPNDNSIHHGFF